MRSTRRRRSPYARVASTLPAPRRRRLGTGGSRLRRVRVTRLACSSESKRDPRARVSGSDDAAMSRGMTVFEGHEGIRLLLTTEARTSGGRRSISFRAYPQRRTCWTSEHVFSIATRATSLIVPDRARWEGTKADEVDRTRWPKGQSVRDCPGRCRRPPRKPRRRARSESTRPLDRRLHPEHEDVTSMGCPKAPRSCVIS